MPTSSIYLTRMGVDVSLSFLRVPALVAQLAEHLHGKEGVIGSNPIEGSPDVIVLSYIGEFLSWQNRKKGTSRWSRSSVLSVVVSIMSPRKTGEISKGSSSSTSIVSSTGSTPSTSRRVSSNNPRPVAPTARAPVSKTGCCRFESYLACTSVSRFRRCREFARKNGLGCGPDMPSAVNA